MQLGWGFALKNEMLGEHSCQQRLAAVPMQRGDDRGDTWHRLLPGCRTTFGAAPRRHAKVALCRAKEEEQLCRRSSAQALD